MPGITLHTPCVVATDSPLPSATYSVVGSDSITVTAGGSNYASVPSVSISGGGAITQATAHAIINGSNQVSSIVMDSAGTGYTSVPVVNISNTTGTQASASVTTSSLYPNGIAPIGGVEYLAVNFPGSGYTTASVTVSGDGSGATASASISLGQISSINIITPGSGYTTVSTTITGNGTGAISIGYQLSNGNIVDPPTVTSPGSGYIGTSVPVNVSGGGGSGAAGVANISGGQVTSITLSNNGTGYTSAPSISIPPPPTGAGATATYVLGIPNGRLTATSNGALSVNSISASISDRILVKNQAASSQNGIYSVITPGSSGSAFVLERSSDMPNYNSSLASPYSDTLWQGAATVINSGSEAGNTWDLTTNNPIQIGTTGLTWALYSGAGGPPFTLPNYVAGNVIPATDYNTLVTQLNSIYANVVNDPTWNYGRVSLTNPTQTTGNLVKASDWTQVFETVYRIGNHQGTSLGSIPRSVATGTEVVAFSDLATVVTNLGNSRFNVATGQFTYTPNRSTKTHSGNWVTSLNQTIDIQFVSYDAARFFFNLGGNVSVNVTRSGVVGSPADTAWNSLLTSVGELRFNHAKMASVNGYKNLYSVGYFNLATSPQVVYHATPTGSYASDYLEVTAAMVTTVSTNDTVRLVLKLSGDGISTVSGTFNSVVGDTRSAGEIVYSEAITYNTSAITGS